MTAQPPGEPQWTSNYFGDEPAPASHGARLGRGMVGHVHIVAALMIVQGFLELAFGGVMLSSSVLFFNIRDGQLPNAESSAIFCLILGIPGLIGGALHLWAGPLTWQFRRRKFGIAALGIGLVTVLTCCALTGIPLAVYGLVVLLNDSVIAAFEMGDRNHSVAEIQKAFPAERPE